MAVDNKQKVPCMHELPSPCESQAQTHDEKLQSLIQRSSEHHTLKKQELDKQQKQQIEFKREKCFAHWRATQKLI